MKMEKETRLKVAILLSLLFMCIEIIGGYLANSIAIFSDAAHLLTDIAGFGIALVATIASKQPPTKRLTFGFARAEVFGALASVLSLWVITFFLLYAAFDRAWKWYSGHAEPVDGFLMFVVACFGVLVNLCLGYVFHEDHGGGLHPGHSHEHHHHHPSSHDGSENGGYQKVDYSDIESPHDHSHGHDHPSPKHRSDHSHDHGHQSDDYEHVHDDHDHSHGHEHNHGHDHDHQSCSGHDHSHSKLITEKKVNESTPLLGGGHDHHHDHPRYDGHDHCDDGHNHDHFAEDNHLHESDVNIQAAYLHVLTDLIQSIGVALAGVIMWQYPHYEIIDPICTLIFSIIALHSTLPLLSRVFLILFEGTPTQIDWETVMDKFNNIPGVDNVHDLHIWNISSTSISLTCHMRATNPQQALLTANQICRKLGIHHTTIQVHDAADDRFCYSQVCDGESKDFAANRAGLSTDSSKGKTMSGNTTIGSGCMKSDKVVKSDTKV